jgi:hypothetical protein
VAIKAGFLHEWRASVADLGGYYINLRFWFEASLTPEDVGVSTVATASEIALSVDCVPASRVPVPASFKACIVQGRNLFASIVPKLDVR